MRRRLMLFTPGLVVVAVCGALIAGLSVTGAGAATRGATGNGPGPRSAAATMRMQMPMPAAGAASAPVTRELRRRIVHVTISNFKFEPQHLVVSAGTRVVWTNKDSEPHTVTSDARRGFASQALSTGGRYTLVAGKKGTFAYHCQIHPFMHGLLVVQH